MMYDGYLREDIIVFGNMFGKIDQVRYELLEFAVATGKSVVANRLYLSGEDIQLNITIGREMYLIKVDDDGYEVLKRDKKTSISHKYRVEFDSLRNGSFLELFAK